MLLSCKACDAPLKADDVNMEHGIATCRYCNAVMRFSELDSGASEVEETPAERAAVPMPSGITVEDWGGRLRIVRSWFTPVAFFLIFFCIAWNAFLIFWYTMAFSGNAPWIMKVFPIAHVAVGVGLTYFTIACFVNKTTITVEAGQLSVHHGPLPWLGSGSYNTTDFEQFYCREHTRHGKNGSQTSYALHAVIRDGRNRKLVSGLYQPEQALYIEQQLEEHLGIEDRAVGGELPR